MEYGHEDPTAHDHTAHNVKLLNTRALTIDATIIIMDGQCKHAAIVGLLSMNL